MNNYFTISKEIPLILQFQIKDRGLCGFSPVMKTG